MNKYFHGLLLGVSVLPALAIMPAIADDVNYVAKVGDTQFETLGAAFSAVEKGGALEGQQVKVIADVTNGAGKSFKSDSNIVIDFGGKTFTAYETSVGSTGTETQVFQLLRDSTITMKNGTINVANPTALTGKFKMGIQNYSNLTLDNMVIDGRNLIDTEAYTVSNNFGTVNILNSKIIAKENGYAFDVWRGLSPTYTDVSVNVEDSEIIGRIEVLTRSTGYAIGDNVQELVISRGIMAAETGKYRKLTNNATVTLNNLSMNGNYAKESGAAIYNKAFPDGYSKGTVNINNVEFAENVSTVNGGAIYNAANSKINFAGTNTFTGNTDSTGANDIHNLGIVTVASGTTTIDGGITGDGTLAIAQGATLNIGTASVEQGAIALDGTMLATLRDGDAQITAGTFDGNGTLKLSFAGEGTYHVFGNTAFRKAGIDVTSSMYDITWADNDKDLIVSVKSVEDIAEANGIEQDAAAAIVGLNTSTSEKLNDLGVLIQEKLAEATPEAKHEVEQATKAIHPEKESVTQSVATSVQTAVTNLASARMAAPTIGRNGGDLNLTSGGVWAQGLFNKSKQNNSFDGYTRGVAVGLDGTINKVWTVGAGYSYAHSDINGSARDTEIDSNTVFVYGQYKPAEWYMNAVANYTMSDYSEKGAALGTPVTADYDIDSFGVAIATGYDFASGVTPELGLRYMHVNSESYTNSLDVKNKFDSTDYMTAMLGTKYGFNIMANRNMMFRPELRCAVKYDLLSDKSSASVIMPGVNAYTINGDRLSRIGGEFGIGLGMKYNAMDLSINYDIDVRDDYTSQTGMLKFRYNF